MMRSILLAMAALGLLSLTACGNRARSDQGPGAGTVVPGAGSQGNTVSDTPVATASALPESGAGAAAVGGGLLDRKVIYFDFDRADIRPEFADVIAAHARKLAADATLKVTLEGNTDERGTREYNIGLGERRAQAVRRALMLQGAPEAQISTVSFGEERPAVEGDDEAAWAQNRRVEIAYGR